MRKPTENQDGCIPNIEKHWLYHPMLDGYGPPAEDPLIGKACRLHDLGARIITDTVREEGGGIVHILEWIELVASGDTHCNRPVVIDL